MGSPDKKLSEIANIVKSWIPRRSEPANVSRDFWMPDQSCRVCYECDSQFTIFNRRHHCRLCGRVFCAKCTANSIPVSSANDSRGEDWERIRVCNYCYKQWEQDLARIENGAGEPSPGLSKSPSARSLASSKSSCTCHSSNSTVGSTPYSTGPYQHVSSSSNFSTRHSPQMDPVTFQQETLTCQKSTSREVTMEDSLPTQLGLCMNRSDDEDDDYGVYHSDSETRHLSSANDRYNTVDIDGMDKVYGPLQMQPDGANKDEKSLSCSSLAEHYETKCMEGVKKFGNEDDKHDSSDECDTPSYDVKSTKAEPVDFENNGLLWLPPDPEDEEDEREAALFDDDDEEEGATGEWGYLRSSNSFGSGESRSRDKSSEEHRKAMKNVVEGHFRALVAQLLQVENLPVHNDHDTDNWLDIITSLAWEAATLLKPDMSRSGGMDPGGYVKIKCIACGRRCESTVIKGVVCKKNVAHRRMKSRIDRPRFLILGGALEYQRVSNLLSSVDTLLQQEMDHLKMAVAKIEAHHPKVLLVEKSVSRYAQEYLLAKDISLVLNVKKPLLERIARCTGAQIVSSIDHLISPKLGYCDTFHVDKLLEEHGSAGQCGKKLTKTLMFFEGCPKPLGCTILLKGASGDDLKKVKHILQYGVFAAYHLALETSFLADEGASLPELPLKSPITVALPDKPSSIDRSISTIPGFSILAGGRSPGSQARCTLQKTNKGSVSDRGLSNSRDLILKLEGHDSTRSCIPSSCPPNSIESTASSTSLSIPPQFLSHSYHSELSPISASKVTDSLGIEEIFQAVKANAGESKLDYSLNSNTFSYETGHADCNSLAVIQGSKDVTSVSQECNHDNEVESSKEVFPPPSDHQSILVSLSTRCVWKGTVCERAHLFRIKYYGSFDKPLGRYLRDHLFDENYLCHSCGMPSEAHVHCYTHQQGSLTISVKKLKEILLPGEKDGKIWMWHRCLRCPRTNGFPPATRRVLMSNAAWGLSFGKFLELSFSNHAAASRVATCGHSLHRDCLRFYGYGRMIACFHYAAINVLSVYLPPPKLEFYYDDQGWIQKEANEVYDQAELLFTEVKNALLQISLKISTTMSQDAGTRTTESKQGIAELEEMLQKEKEEFEEALQKALCKEEKGGQTVYDILEINKLRRQIFFHSFVWDQRLIHAASLSNNNIQESFNSSIPKSEVKPVSSTEKVVELNLSNKPAKGFSNCDSFHLEDKPKISQQGETGPTSQSGGVQNNDQMEREQGHGIQSEFRLSSSASTNDKSDPLDSEKLVCRAFSEGEYPIVADLSHTLDAAWTGESQPTSTAQKEDQYPSADSTQVGSTALINANTIPTNLENSAFDQVNVEGTYSLGSSIPQKGLENVESAMKWVSMSFSNVNRSINKSALLSAQKLCNGEYNPIFVCVFREWEQQSGARLLLPVGVNDTVIPVYDDEPTSIIAYALVSLEYRIQMSKPEIQKDDVVTSASLPLSLYSFDEAVDTYRSMGSTDASILSLSGLHSSQVVDPLYSKDLHARVSFTDDGSLGKVKYSVTCYFAKRFEALRRKCCPSELDYVRSLSRCKKWGAQGGKSNVFFAKTLDDRFIIKQVTKTELESFIKFGPAYFRYLSESISTGSPTCLAKILGIYQVSSKHMKGGKEFKMDVLVMENLLYRRNITRVYDLKGSSRSRYNPDTSGSNKILLDQNLIEAMPTSPIFVGNKAKRLLERAVWNDTSFLGSIDVMDYSLLVGMDEERHELVLGIIDFMRQYTWDKHLETWVKTSGILGGPKNSTPTVISPQQYKKRFRKAMTAYFLMVPDQWSPQTIIPSGSQSDLCEENTQGVNSPVMAVHKDVS